MLAIDTIPYPFKLSSPVFLKIEWKITIKYLQSSWTYDNTTSKGFFAKGVKVLAKEF